MKTKHLLVALFALMGSLMTYAHDFEVDGICYNILDEDAATVETTYYNATRISQKSNNSNTLSYKLWDFKKKSYTGIAGGFSTSTNSCGIENLDSIVFSYGGGSTYSSYSMKFFYFYENDVIIPEKVIYNNKEYNVVRIGERTFANCRFLKSVSVPATVVSIGEYAFAARGGEKYTWNSSTYEMTWAESMLTSALTDVNFASESMLTTIEDYAFYYAQVLTKQVIPANVTDIAENALPNSTVPCVLCVANEPPAYALTTTTQLSPILLVPYGTVDKYKAAEPWKYYQFIIPCNPQEFLDAETEYKATGISISPTDISLPLGETIKPSVIFQPDKTTNKKLTWTSLNTAVATVAEDGTVSAIAIGTATITATTQDGTDLTATLTVSVIDEDDITLTDGGTYDLGIEHEFGDAAYTRTFNNTNWQAWYVPFSLEYNDWSTNFDMARINDVHQFDDDDDGIMEVTALEVANLKAGSHTEPNTPYLIRAKATGTYTFIPTNKTLYPAEENSFEVTSWNNLFTFTGTYCGVSGSEMVANGYYVMGGGTLHKANKIRGRFHAPEFGDDDNTGDDDTGSTETDLYPDYALAPYRWYMAVSDRYGNPVNLGEVKIMCLDDEWEETGIDELTMENGQLTMKNSVYDLSGRKLSNSKFLNGQIRKGIYIKNGKKVFVK